MRRYEFINLFNIKDINRLDFYIKTLFSEEVQKCDDYRKLDLDFYSVCVLYNYMSDSDDLFANLSHVNSIYNSDSFKYAVFNLILTSMFNPSNVDYKIFEKDGSYFYTTKSVPAGSDSLCSIYGDINSVFNLPSIYDVASDNAIDFLLNYYANHCTEFDDLDFNGNEWVIMKAADAKLYDRLVTLAKIRYLADIYNNTI